jgi:hypothetical protein
LIRNLLGVLERESSEERPSTQKQKTKAEHREARRFSSSRWGWERFSRVATEQGEPRTAWTESFAQYFPPSLLPGIFSYPQGDAMLELTPETKAEVRRNLLSVFGTIAACLLLVVFALTMVINPPGSSERFRFASFLMVAFILPVLAMVGACLTLAYPLGCWPSFMRSKRLSQFDGIDAESLSNKGMRRWMTRRAYWIAFTKGAVVGLAFIGPWFLTAWATSRRGFPEGYFFPSLLMIFYCGGLAAKALVVRHLFTERIVKVSVS